MTKTAAYPDRQSAAYSAKLALEIRRNTDAVKAMKFVALMGSELTVEERDLLNSAYENVMTDILSVRTTLSAKLQKEESPENIERINDNIQRLDKEMNELCNDAKSILDNHVIPRATHEDKVFYYTMIGDHFRFCAKLKAGNERKELANESRAAYEMAHEIGLAYLHNAHHLRITLALKHSFLFYDVLNRPHNALHMLKKATSTAISDPMKLAAAGTWNLVDGLLSQTWEWMDVVFNEEGEIRDDKKTYKEKGSESA